MDLDNIQINDIGVQLNLILANRLVFETKEEFARYAKYSVDNRTSITGLQYEKQIALIEDLTERYLAPTGYDDFSTFFEMYRRASRFYEREFSGKAILRDPQCALKMAESLYSTHRLTGERKLDGILVKLYDYELESPQLPRVDFEILLLMVLGVLPPMSVRGPRTDSKPDFKKEWDVVLDFITECCSFRELFETNPRLDILKKKGEEQSFQKNRFFFLEAVTDILGYVDRVSRPQNLDQELFYYGLDGLWQNWIGNSIPEKNVFFEFVFGGQGYNFIRYEVYPTYIKRAVFYGEFFYDGDTRVFHVTHPRGIFEHLIGKTIRDSDWVNYKVSSFPKDNNYPTELELSPYMGGPGFPLRLEKLRKIDETQYETVIKDIESPGRVFKEEYEEYRCIYPVAEGIYAITKTDIFILDPDEEGYFYKVPKEIDERLETLTVDDKGGILEVGKEKTRWIGFESVVLFFPPEVWEGYGIGRVDSIE